MRCRTVGNQPHDLVGDQEDPNRQKACVKVRIQTQELHKPTVTMLPDRELYKYIDLCPRHDLT